MPHKKESITSTIVCPDSCHACVEDTSNVMANVVVNAADKIFEETPEVKMRTCRYLHRERACIPFVYLHRACTSDLGRFARIRGVARHNALNHQHTG
jgi:hypothetical protein